MVVDSLPYISFYKTSKACQGRVSISETKTAWSADFVEDLALKSFSSLFPPALATIDRSVWRRFKWKLRYGSLTLGTFPVALDHLARRKISSRSKFLEHRFIFFEIKSDLFWPLVALLKINLREFDLRSGPIIAGLFPVSITKPSRSESEDEDEGKLRRRQASSLLKQSPLFYGSLLLFFRKNSDFSVDTVVSGLNRNLALSHSYDTLRDLKRSNGF